MQSHVFSPNTSFFGQQDIITAFITSVSHETFVSVTCVLIDHRGIFSPFAFVIAHFFNFYILFVARFHLCMRLFRRVCWLLWRRLYMLAFVIFIRQIALVMRFSGQFVPFTVHFASFAVRFASFCSVFAFLRCVRIFAVHFTVFSVLLMIFLLRPAQLWRGGNGYYTAEKYFLYLFRRFIDKQKG